MSDQENTNLPVEPTPAASNADNATPVTPEPVVDTTPLVWEAPAPAPTLSAPAPVWSAQPQVAETNAWAIVSLVASILSWVGLFGIGGIVGLVCGIIARNQIRDSAGRQTGDGLAIAGIVLGGINVVISCIGLLCVFVALAGMFSMPFMYNGR
jgi:hypothetical protein